MATNDAIKEDGRNAEQLLSNDFFQRKIWDVMRKILDNRMLACNTSKEPDVALDIVRYRQILDEFEAICKKAVERAETVRREEIKTIRSKARLEKVFKR